MSPMSPSPSEAYTAALKRKDDAIKARLRPIQPPPKKVQNWIYDNEIAFEGQKRMPQWMQKIVKQYELEKEQAYEEAIEAFMESDEAEEIIENLVKAKKQLDQTIV